MGRPNWNGLKRHESDKERKESDRRRKTGEKQNPKSVLSVAVSELYL